MLIVYCYCLLLGVSDVGQAKLIRVIFIYNNTIDKYPTGTMQTVTTTTSHLIYTTVLIITLLFCSTSAIDCNATHFQFFSNYSLGKQEELNKTFTQLEPLIKISNITYHAADSSTFTISDFTFRLRYIDSNQKAVIMGKNNIGIIGGVLQLFVGFKWAKSNMVMTINGTGEARINSDQIMFEKELIVDGGYLDWNLSFYYNISLFHNKFTIVRIDPSNTTAADITEILNAINGNPDKPQNMNLRAGLESFINPLYPSYLRRNLKNEHYPLDDHFEYVYYNPWSLQNISVLYDLHPTGHTLQKDGLSLTFVSYIKDDPKWKCGKMVPTQQLNPQIYGGLQEFISFSVFENTIRSAFERGILNTKLNRNNWQSRFFQFYAGDLYEVIPEIGNRYLATQSVLGNCTFNPQQQVTIKRHNSSTLNTTTVHNCILTIQGVRISQFEVKLTVQVEASANSTHLNFHIIHSEGQYNFKLVPDFVMKNQELAQHMITHSLQRLREGLTFGSGWKIFPRDYAHVTINDDFVFIYDSTHVETKQDQNQKQRKSGIVQGLQTENKNKLSNA